MLNGFLSFPGGDYAVLAVCAHEFGHIKQFETDVPSVIRHWGLAEYCIELHADFLAGYFIRIFSEGVPQTRLQLIGHEWSKMGHPTKSGSHGTSGQRVLALESGFEFAKDNPARSIATAITAGLDHVARYKA